MKWSSPDCFDEDNNFICKNMDMHPAHFDVAIQGLPQTATDTMGVWPISTNPKVSAYRIDCPEDLKQIVTDHCGSNSGSSATPDEYCPGHDKYVYYNKKSNTNGYWPSP